MVLATAAALAAPSGPGRYEAELCVATQANAAPTCGAADVEIAAGSLMLVRIADIEYRLALHGDKPDVQTMHGKMQIDEFSAAYLWDGTTLRFSDADKDVRYEVRVGARKGRSR